MKKHILSLSLLVFATLQIATAQTYSINTFAGNDTAGYSGDGGPAIKAKLYNPIQTVSDKLGNLYIADDMNQRIRKVDVHGIITTVAGTGVTGNTGDGGLATLAKLNSPTSLAIDDTGNLYVCCYMASVVRKINTQGIISTVAGNGSIGFSGDNGPAISAKLGLPRGVAVDHAGNIYIADQGNDCVRKVTASTGIITTYAGIGTSPGYSGNGSAATSAQLSNPIEIAVDDTGNLYIADYGNNVIRKVNTLGIISTIVGTGNPGFSGDGGPALSAELQNTTGLAIDKKGNIYLTNAAAQRVRKVDGATGIINTFGGTGVAGHTGDCGPALLAELKGPVSVSIDSAGNIYVSEYTANSDVRKLIPNGIHGVAFNLTATVPTPVSLCQGQSATLTASGETNYVWVGTTDSTNSIVVSPAKDTTYELLVTDGSCTLDTAIAVTVNPIPTVDVEPKSPSFCAGNGPQLTASGANTYSWSPSTGLSATTGSQVTANPSITTTYTITGTTGGCSATDTDVYTVKPAPLVGFDYGIVGKQVNFNIDSSTGDVTTYSWDFGDTTATSSKQYPSHTYAYNGTYYVCLTVYNNSNCSYTRCQYVEVGNTGVQNISGESNFQLYPNPASNQLTVNSDQLAGNSIIITNMLGQTLITQIPLPDSKQTTIDVSSLSAGIYLLEIKSSEGMAVKKFVKE